MGVEAAFSDLVRGCQPRSWFYGATQAGRNLLRGCGEREALWHCQAGRLCIPTDTYAIDGKQ